VLGRAPPPPQQLPAQMFTTAAQLLDLTDSKLPGGTPHSFHFN
jgi:U6 snRNA-associated Sm-like protein LSm1